MSSPEGSTVTFRRIPKSVARRPIERFARTLQHQVSKGRPFDILITGDADLRRLNRDFRNSDYPTDVLSFPTSASSASDLCVSASPRQSPSRPAGDIAISYARARAQARAFGHSTENEIRILMLHGLLHLMGLDHETDRGRMARAEKRWRARLGLPNGLIERTRS